MDRVYDVKNLKITEKTISFDLLNEPIIVPLSKTGSSVLPKANPKHLQIYELDHNGLGIHWPLLDEDLSIEGLLRSAGRQDLIVEHRLPDWYHQEHSSKIS